MGKVYLVGAGIGNSGLITAYGKELVENAQCIIYDRLIGDELLSLANDSCEKIYVGKANHKHTLSQEDINLLLLKKAGQYSTVVRLKGGDPYVFGRGAEEALFLKENGVSFEVVSGVSSVTAALAYAGIPVTKRGVADSFRVVTAHTKEDIMNSIDFASMKSDSETLIFLMGLRHIEDISKALIDCGRSENTAVAVISNATTPKQKKCIGTLKNIATLVRESELCSPAVIVVGRVVEFSRELDFYESKRFFGKKYFVPYIEGIEFSFNAGLKSVKQSPLVKELIQLGAQVVTCKTGKIVCVPFDINVIKTGQCLVFTSKNAVYSVFSQLKDIRKISGCKIACVGKKTANVLCDFGLEADIISNGATAKELAKLLENEESIIYFSSENSEGELEKKLKLTKVICYENTPVQEVPDAVLSDCDAVIFTCASNVRRTLKLTDGILPERIYSIGPSCSEELKRQGINSFLQAKYPSFDALIELL